MRVDVVYSLRQENHLFLDITHAYRGNTVVVNGKQKGSAFERTVCRLLSQWVSHGKHDDLYWRSAMSGGRATVAKKKGIDVRQAGDITSVSPEGHALTDLFYLECKFYRDLQIDSFILDNKGKLAEFWRVAKREAKRHNRLPMLIAKENRREPIIITRERDLKLIVIVGPIFRGDVGYDSISTLDPDIRYLSHVLKWPFKVKDYAK